MFEVSIDGAKVKTSKQCLKGRKFKEIKTFYSIRWQKYLIKMNIMLVRFTRPVITSLNVRIVTLSSVHSLNLPQTTGMRAGLVPERVTIVAIL